MKELIPAQPHKKRLELLIRLMFLTIFQLSAKGLLNFKDVQGSPFNMKKKNLKQEIQQ